MWSGSDSHTGSTEQDTEMHEQNRGSTRVETSPHILQSPSFVHRLQTTMQIARSHGPAAWKQLLQSGATMDEETIQRWGLALGGKTCAGICTPHCRKYVSNRATLTPQASSAGEAQNGCSDCGNEARLKYLRSRRVCSLPHLVHTIFRVVALQVETAMDHTCGNLDVADHTRHRQCRRPGMRTSRASDTVT